MPRLLIAPQEFKGSLTAVEAAAAIVRGIAAAQPSWQADVLPLSDGGPGFLDAIEGAAGGERIPVPAHDALLRPVAAEILWDARERLAVVESARANGLTLIAPEARDARAADSFGVGELIAAALERGPRRLIVGVGGSATTDGGHGMARALGARFLDGAGRPLPPGGAALAALERIDWRPPPSASGVDIVVATDVTNPLTGPSGAAAVYGPQKGASPADVDVLDAALARFAAVVRRALGVDIAGMAGSGAAGGLAGGIVAFLGGRLASGFELVAEVTGLRARLERADAVVTGEGSYDAQSLQGKVVGRLASLARELGKPCIVFAGRAATGGPEVFTLASLEPDPSKSIANASRLLEELARTWAARSALGRSR